MTTQELTQAVRALDTKTAAHEVRLDDYSKRLCSAEDSVKEQNRILVVIERLTNGIDTLNYKVGELGVKVDGFGKRLSCVELEPAQKWKAVTFKIIEYIALAGIGFLAAKLFGGV